MIVSFIQISEIFKELPVGYYLGRKIEYKLDEHGDMSYFDPASDKIVISYPTIAQTLTRVDRELTRVELEQIVRGLLYHEVSHVIYTPRIENTNYLNIFEDERIETLCAKTYMNVNFKKNCILINDYHGEAPTSPESAFYHLVRFHHVDDEKWLDRLHSLLIKWSGITANDSSYAYDYKDDIKRFYEEFIAEYKEKMDKPEDFGGSDDTPESGDDTTTTMKESSDSSTGDGSTTIVSISDDTEDDTDGSKGSDTEDKDDTEDSTDTTDAISPEGKGGDDTETSSISDKIKPFDDLAKSLDDFKKDASSIIDKYNDSNLTDRLRIIIANKLKANKKTGSAINAYSGRLDVRSVGTREDYKWWTQTNREGHIRRFSKCHINLFVDCSGSFCSNDVTMNKFIKSLDKIEKEFPNFTFDVITINTKVTEWTTHNQIFRSNGGNNLYDSIKNVINKHTKPNVNTYNIVLFDGDAHSNDDRDYTKEQLKKIGTKEDPFRHFNLSNTIIVSSPSNARYIDNVINKAKVVYTHRYCAEFIDNICSLLERVI